MHRSLRLLAILLFVSGMVLAQGPVDRPMLISRVALNQTQLAFTYAGKIWLVAQRRRGKTADQYT